MSLDRPKFNVAEATTELARLKPPPYLEGFEGIRYSHLGMFVNNILLQFSHAAELYEKQLAPPPRFVVLFMGPPGNGKSYLTDKFNAAVEGWGEKHYADRLLDKQGQSAQWFTKLTWEEHGLKAARQEGAITTPRHQLANAQGLKRANELYEGSLAEAAKVSFITSAEEVDAAAIVVDPATDDFFRRYQGRAMGNDAARNLFLNRGSFASVGKDVNLKKFAIGVCAGPELEVLASHRFEMKNASSLKEAKRISEMFGKEVPADQARLEEIQNDGASEEQMAGIYETLREQVRSLKGSGKLVDPTDPFSDSTRGEGKIWLPNWHKFEDDYQDIQKAVGMRSEKRKFGAFMRLAVGALLQYICETDYHLQRGSGDYGIFLNAPPLSQLGIEKKQQRALRRYFVVKEALTSPY